MAAMEHVRNWGWICSVSADGTGFPQSKSIDIRLSLEHGHVWSFRVRNNQGSYEKPFKAFAIREGCVDLEQKIPLILGEPRCSMAYGTIQILCLATPFDKNETATHACIDFEEGRLFIVKRCEQEEKWHNGNYWMKMPDDYWYHILSIYTIGYSV